MRVKLEMKKQRDTTTHDHCSCSNANHSTHTAEYVKLLYCVCLIKTCLFIQACKLVDFLLYNYFFKLTIFVWATELHAF